MNKDEMKMIEEMATHMVDYCHSVQRCPYIEDSNVTCEICKAHSLYNANCRILADDEFILNQSEIDELRKDQAEVKFLKNKIKQETAKEIFQEFLKEFVVYACVGDYYTATEIYNKIQDLAKEKGIELE